LTEEGKGYREPESIDRRLILARWEKNTTYIESEYNIAIDAHGSLIRGGGTRVFELAEYHINEEKKGMERKHEISKQRRKEEGGRNIIWPGKKKEMI